MRPRQAAKAVVLLVLLLGAALGVYRSARVAGDDDPARRLAAGLRCPACQGESVADSRSPIAAAMREVIADQLQAGHSPAEVRTYLVSRYGAEILAAPPARGWGLLLWLVPALALGIGTGSALRGHRRTRRYRHTPVPATRPAPVRSGTARPEDRTRRAIAAGGIWNAGAVAVLALVGGVAVAAPHLTAVPRPAAAPDPVASADPVLDLLALARTAEGQGRYEAAAQMYRTALAQRPDDEIRLRLAFTLIRTGRSAEAARLAETVLAGRPDAPDALLMLGLAQRDTDPATSTRTLRRFLDRAPGHPAAAEIRRMVEAG